MTEGMSILFVNIFLHIEAFIGIPFVLRVLIERSLLRHLYLTVQPTDIVAMPTYVMCSTHVDTTSVL